MKILKRILLAGVILAAFSGFGQAALAGGGDYAGATAAKPEMMKNHDPEAKFEHFSKVLNLSKDQQEKIRPIKEGKEKAIKELYSETRDRKLKIVDDTHAKIKAILTLEQQKKYDEMIAKHKAEFNKYHHGHGMMPKGHGHPEMGEHPATSDK